MKDVHPLYQLQVVLGNNDVIIAPTKPKNWATQLAMIER
jgi:antitoxin component of MazEF toxin-antitoxin module